MFRRKKKGASEANPAEAGATTAIETAEADGQMEAPPPPPSPPPAPEPVAEAEPAEASDGDGARPRSSDTEQAHRPEARPGEDNYGPGYDGDSLPPRIWVESVLDTRPPPSRDELARQAEADFQAAIAPSLQGLRAVVPDASSPEEARRVLEERESEIEFPADTEGERMRANDIFKTEATVHYRIQKQMERPRGRVGWGRSWEPPAGLARQTHDSGRRSLPRGTS
jgi:hypothetical protein